MKVVFLGSSDFSLTVLQALVNSSHKVLACVMGVDQKVGRGGKVEFSPVKKFCLSQNIPFFQYKSVSKQGFEDISSFQPDVLVTASFGQILRQNILTLAPFGVINVHASLLPKYRGSCPANWVLINGEKQTGVTIMQTALSLDTGDMLMQRAFDILPGETAGELLGRLATLGAQMLPEALDLLESGKAVFTKQNEHKFKGFMGWLYNFFTFKNMLLETLLKILYIIVAIYITLSSFSLISISFIAFILQLTLGNLLARIGFEFSLLLLTICKNTTEINDKLSKTKKEDKKDKE